MEAINYRCHKIHLIICGRVLEKSLKQGIPRHHSNNNLELNISSTIDNEYKTSNVTIMSSQMTDIVLCIIGINIQQTETGAVKEFKKLMM